MKITYDPEVDAAYIYITHNPEERAQETYSCDELPEIVKGEINLDFAKDGSLIGIEFLWASKILPKAVLQRAISKV